MKIAAALCAAAVFAAMAGGCGEGVESVSAEDEAYFAGMMEDYLLSAGKSQHHTVETHYEAHGGTLIARFTVTYHDPEQGAWVENYVAGKSLQ